MTLIEAKNVGKAYHDEKVETVALESITLSIDKGEFVAIMGQSGSGKSTLLHILGFLDKNTSGEYIFDGKQATNYGEEEVAQIRNKKMGFVFQSFNLLPRATVLENVKLPLVYSGVSEEKWDEIAMRRIKQVGLEERADFEPSQLSGGEKQRAAIARALVNDPDVIFADEPTGNLDSKSGKTVMEVISRLNEEEKRTVILITHEKQTAEYADRIITLKDGAVESDVLAQTKRRAGDEFSK